MQLVIDIGNTRVKAALFEKKELSHFLVFNNVDDLLQSDLIAKYQIKNCIVCSVISNIEPFIEQLKKQTSVLVYTIPTPSPITNKYESPDTLGSDRLAAAVAGNHMYKNENVLIVDVGTCIKYNFINSKNEFIGGAISPGLEMRFKSINTFTAHLPLLKVDDNFNSLIGKNSKENILSGVELGAVAEVNSFIEQYQHLYSDLHVILTGGDTDFFENRLKKAIFVDPYLTLRGLNIILDYNLH